MYRVTHCPRGHEYTEENTRLYQGRRFCRACEKLRSRPGERERRRLATAARWERIDSADMPCAFCGEQIPVKRRRSYHPVKFCSIACARKERTASGKSAEAARRSHFKTKYGLTVEQVEAMASAGCAICGTTDWPGKDHRPHVDHCHETGKVRGVLCHYCNTAIGALKHDPELIRRAADYLEG